MNIVPHRIEPIPFRAKRITKGTIELNEQYEEAR